MEIMLDIYSLELIILQIQMNKLWSKSINKIMYFEEIGDDFDKFMSPYDVQQRIHLIYDNLLKKSLIQPDSDIIEIGCGTGKISEALVKTYKNLTVSDISEKLTNHTAERLQIKGLSFDCTDIPLPNNSYDAVISSECIEHTTDPMKAILEMTRILKPHGILILTTPNKLWYPALIMARILRIRKFNGIENWTWPHVVKKWLKNNDFEDIHMSGVHILPFQLPYATSFLPYFDSFGHLLYPIMINYGFLARKK